MPSAAVLNTSQNIDKDSVSNTEKNVYTFKHTQLIDINWNYCWRKWIKWNNSTL